MTNAQLQFFRYKEEQRHNLAQETESHRTNVTHESLQKYATDVQKWTTATNAETSRYVARTNYAASKYAADTNAATQRYVSDQNAKTQRAVATLQAEVNRYSAQLSSSASRYGSDQSALASRYSANLTASTAANRLKFDRDVQSVVNSLNAQRVQIERLKQQSEASLNSAKVQQIARSVANAAQQLALNARELDMKEEASKWNNLYTQARSIESAVNTTRNAVGIVSQLDRLIQTFEGRIKTY